MQVSCRSAVLCDVDLDHLRSADPQGCGAQCNRIGSCRNQGSRGNQRSGMPRRDGPDADVEAEDLLLETCRRGVREDVVLPFRGKALVEDKVPVLQQARVDVQEDGQIIVDDDDVQLLREFHLIVAHRRAVSRPGHSEVEMPCQVFLACRRYLQASLSVWLSSLQGERSGDGRRSKMTGDAEEHQKERTGRAGGSDEHVELPSFQPWLVDAESWLVDAEEQCS